MSQRGMEVNERNQSQLENSESEAPPQLRFMDQTPKPSNMPPDNKRTRTELSPPSEDIIGENITSRIGKIVEKTVSQRIPKIIQDLQSSLQQLIHEEIEILKRQIKERFSNKSKTHDTMSIWRCYLNLSSVKPITGKTILKYFAWRKWLKLITRTESYMNLCTKQLTKL